MKQSLKKIRFQYVLMAMGGLLMAFLLSAFVALAGPEKPTFLLIGAMAATFLLLLDNSRLIFLLGVMVFLVIGQLLYFAKINQALWLPYGLSALLFLRIPSAYLQSPFAKSRVPIPLLLPLLFFFLILLLSIALNTPPLLQVMVGGKNLIMLWSVFLLIALFAIPFSAMERMIGMLFGVVFLQIPFVLYQYFIVAPKRSNLGGRHGVAWDAIVGSLGGDPNAGGLSGSMAFLLVVGMILAISLYRYRQIGKKMLVAIWLAGLLCIGLAEVKVVVVLLPIGIAILFWKDLFARPLKAVLGLISGVVLALCILVAYNEIHSNQSNKAHDLTQLLDQNFGYVLDPTLINFETGEMGRSAAIMFWWSEGFGPDPLRGLLGYGPGASRSSSSLAVGEIARKYKFGIDRSSATQLLWEVGLVGFLAYLLIFGGAAWMALRSADNFNSARTKATLEACGASLCMALLMLPYGRDMLEAPALTFTMMCLLGYVAQAYGLRTLASALRKGAPLAVIVLTEQEVVDLQKR